MHHYRRHLIPKEKEKLTTLKKRNEELLLLVINLEKERNEMAVRLNDGAMQLREIRLDKEKWKTQCAHLELEMEKQKISSSQTHNITCTKK